MKLPGRLFCFCKEGKRDGQKGKRARGIVGGIAIAIVIAVWLWITLSHRAPIRTAEAYVAEKFSFNVYQTRIYDSIVEGPADYYVVFVTDDQPYPVQFEVGLRDGEVRINDYYSNVSNRILANDLYAKNARPGKTGRAFLRPTDI